MGQQAVTANERVYRTIDGRFVHEGDPEGAFLAYPVGAEIPAGDQARYLAFMENTPQDAIGSESKAAQAYVDEDTRDLLRRRQAGDVSAATRLNEQPILIHDRLATELADEAQAIANATDQSAVAEMRSEAPSEPGPVLATRRIYRTTEGDLVNEGDDDAAVLAYAVGQPISDADVDEYNDLDAPEDADDVESEGATKPPAGAKRATKSANKAAGKPADK